MTNQEICQAIFAIEQSDIISLFEDLDSQEQEQYKLCFNIKSLQLYFCESPNSAYCSAQEVILCILTKNEILDTDNKSIITDKIKSEFGDCDKNKLKL